MIKVGITGGIGSGKSTVCNIFKVLGISVYNSDLESRILANTYPFVINGVKKIFGDHIYVNGKLDRKQVGTIVFKDKDRLNALNNLIHPVVAEHFNHWIKEHSKAKYILKETAILFESGAHKQVDQIITVAAPVDLRIKRVIQRDHISKNEVENRIRNQMRDNERIRLSDHVIHCNEIDLVIPQVVKIHQLLLNTLVR